jgi:hypothetical protein
MSHDGFRRLAVADRILNQPELVEDGAWPRACTWLIRLALEHGLDDFWVTHRPEIVEVPRRAQLLVLTRNAPGVVGMCTPGT